MKHVTVNIINRLPIINRPKKHYSSLVRLLKIKNMKIEGIATPKLYQFSKKVV